MSYKLIQASYYTSEYSMFCKAARRNNKDFSGVNYATFLVENHLGEIYPITANSDGGYHSEKICWIKTRNTYKALEDINTKNAWGEAPSGHLSAQQVATIHKTKILWVYTEREPCSACSPLLASILVDNTLVYYSFVYPSHETKKFHYDEDQQAVFTLLQLKHHLTSHNLTQKAFVKAHQRQWRDEGNKDLKQRLKGMKD